MSDAMTDVENATCIAETVKALLVMVNGKETWVPKSVLGDDSEVYKKNDTGKLYVKQWFAAKVGWDVVEDGRGEDETDHDERAWNNR